MVSVLFVFGTRPEAVKLCPVIREMASQPERFRVETCVTAQHRDLLDQVLRVFRVRPDHDLNLMEPGQTLTSVSAKILAGLEPVLAQSRPEMVVVQGDTATTFCGALAAFHQRIPVTHVEAGLRTGDMGHPFPEELNRILTTRIAALHCAATGWAASNLRGEGVPEERVSVTGNPGIDAVRYVAGRLEAAELTAPDLPRKDPSKKLILVTAHRRESFGAPMEAICAALRRIARRDDVQVVFPAHPIPR